MQDPDLERWSSAWHDQDARLVDLKQRTLRDRRRLILWIICDVLAVLALAAVALWLLLLREPTLLQVVTGAVLLVLSIACSAFLWFNWRSSLAPAADSARDHLALQLQNARARLRYAAFSWTVIAIQLALVALIAYVQTQDGEGVPAGFFWGVGIGLAAAVAATLWIQVRARRRLAALELLSRTLEEE